MFQTELCKHSKIQTVAYSPHTYLETHHWLKGAVVLNMPRDLFAGGKMYKGYGSTANARAYLIDEIKTNVPEFDIPQNDKELIFKGWEALCEKYAQPVFFEKSPQYLAHWASLELMYEWIQSTSYSVKVIGLIRNPMATQYSAFNLFHTKPEHRQFGWADSYNNLLKFSELLDKESYFQIQYEEIINAPAKTFKRICDFIGVEYCDTLGSGSHEESLDKWQEDLYFTLQLDDSVRQIAKQFGYLDDELHNPPKPTPSFIWRLKRSVFRYFYLSLARFGYRVMKPIRLIIKNATT